MRLNDGANLEDYGVAPGLAFWVIPPEEGGWPLAMLPLSEEELALVPINRDTWDELRKDGLAIRELLCLSGVQSAVARSSHSHRVALYTG